MTPTWAPRLPPAHEYRSEPLINASPTSGRLFRLWSTNVLLLSGHDTSRNRSVLGPSADWAKPVTSRLTAAAHAITSHPFFRSTLPLFTSKAPPTGEGRSSRLSTRPVNDTVPRPEVQVFTRTTRARPAAVENQETTPVAQDPQWSLDGRHIFFWGGYDGYQLFSVNVDGTGFKQLTFGNFQDAAPRWSHSGKFIAFARWDFDANGTQ